MLTALFCYPANWLHARASIEKHSRLPTIYRYLYSEYVVVLLNLVAHFVVLHLALVKRPPAAPASATTRLFLPSLLIAWLAGRLVGA